MTVRKGEAWGERVEAPADAAVVTTDAALAALVGAGEGRPLLVRGGDLHRTLGGPRPADSVLRVPIDGLRVVTDGAEHLAVAHVVARRPGRLGWWRGPVVAVMNAEHVGNWDVAPRSHPNDGRADVVAVDAAMGMRARWQARRRLPTGTHVPHPAIRTRRTAQEHFEWPEPLAVWIDGVPIGRSRTLDVSVRPDAAVIHV